MSYCFAVPPLFRPDKIDGRADAARRENIFEMSTRLGFWEAETAVAGACKETYDGPLCDPLEIFDCPK